MPSQQAQFDIRIINGRIIDGTGAPSFRGDLGIKGDVITAIGDLEQRTAAITIDARDQVVAPGFIDLLGQSQNSVLIDPRLEGKVRQGVTTEVTGEGHSPGPISEKNVADRLRADPTDIPRWRTLGEYMKVVEKGGSAINFAFFVGASNPRSMVIGSVDRQATEDELVQMEQIVDQAMREGAIGLSTSLIYIPAVFSTTEEIVRLARVSVRHGGMYFTHIRDEGDRIDSALDEAFQIGREAGIPVNIWHLKVGKKQNWGRMPEVIARIQAARDSGLDVSANVYPYIASSTSLSVLVPSWALEGGYSAFLQRLQQPEERQKIEVELQNQVDARGERGIFVSRISVPELELYEKKFLEEISSMMGTTPVEALLRLFSGHKSSPGAIYFSMSEADVQYALKQPWVSVGADSGAVVGAGKEAGAHPRAYGTFPRVAGHYVRNEKLFSLEEAVRKMTSQAAVRVNIYDRGILRPGMKADVIVFDPARLLDVSKYEDPHHFSVGISDVIVNGVPVLRSDRMTGALPGKVLRGQGK
ncbi:MAG TPA: D-aminoacylase [Thermoanaerobaculia bacterium]|nr:D-aminoacylase [Thermoanaerobaculia bacterium]